jgi:hypothetical protein
MNLLASNHRSLALAPTLVMIASVWGASTSCAPRTGRPPYARDDDAGTAAAEAGLPNAAASAAESAVVASAPSGSSTAHRIGAVAAPVFSDDACASDADCVPLATCHPDRCVAPAHAGTLRPGTMCTMTCMPGTLDCGANRCACAPRPDGGRRCALVAK